MKKRIAAAALCLLLAFQISAPPAEAAGSYAFFMAVGDSILPFSEQTMPFWDNGEKYFTIQGPNGEKIEFVQIL